MRRFILVGLLAIVPYNLLAVFADNFKHDSQAFCRVVHYNNNGNNSLDSQFLFDSAKLVSLINEATCSLHEIATIQNNTTAHLSLDRVIVINEHITRLNAVRKMLRMIQTTHKLSPQLDKVFNFYKNSMDAHYYELNPSYESYFLKQCNISLQEVKKSSMYAGGALCCSLPLFVCNKNLTVQAAFACVAGYLAYKSYASYNAESYEYKLL